MIVTGPGITVDLPSGWEAAIDGGDGDWTTPDGVEAQPETGRPDGSTRRLVAQFANFPLPPNRGDYGDGAIEKMRSGDALVVLVELDPASTATPLLAAEGIPRSLRAADFDPDAVHVPRYGATGAQRFFTAAGRAFALYVVLGSHIDRADDVALVNAVLDSMELS